jgi:hypothetical protein
VLQRLTVYVTIGEQARIQPTATTTSTLASTLSNSGGNGAAEFPRCIRQSIKSTFGNGGQPDGRSLVAPYRYPKPQPKVLADCLGGATPLEGTGMPR